MKALSQAIYSYSVNSAFSNAIGGRFYKARAPEGTIYPYAIYLLVSDVPDNTFTENLEDVLIQFSLFSSASSSTEVEDMFTALKALYDDCALTITGSTLIWMQRGLASLDPEEHTTQDGTVEVWHYSVEYSIKTQVP